MASKIRLDLDSLAVESFETSSRDGDRGTVHGNACSDSTCFQIMCTVTNGGIDNGTCNYSCGGEPCQATHINCSGGTGTGGSDYDSCGCPRTNDQTCCTGFQIDCSCYN